MRGRLVWVCAVAALLVVCVAGDSCRHLRMELKHHEDHANIHLLPQHFQRFKDDAMRDMDREDGSHDRPCDANDEACVRVRDATREAYRRIREHKQRHVDHMASTFNRVNDDYQNALSKIEETKKKLQEAGCPQEGGDL